MWHPEWVGPAFLIINHQKSWAPIVWRGLNSTKSELDPLSKSESSNKKKYWERERTWITRGKGISSPTSPSFSKGYQKGAFQPYVEGCSRPGFVHGRRILRPKPVDLANRTGAGSCFNFSYFFFFTFWGKFILLKAKTYLGRICRTSGFLPLT